MTWTPPPNLEIKRVSLFLWLVVRYGEIIGKINRTEWGYKLSLDTGEEFGPFDSFSQSISAASEVALAGPRSR